MSELLDVYQVSVSSSDHGLAWHSLDQRTEYLEKAGEGNEEVAEALGELVEQRLLEYLDANPTGQRPKHLRIEIVDQVQQVPREAALGSLGAQPQPQPMPAPPEPPESAGEQPTATTWPENGPQAAQAPSEDQEPSRAPETPPPPPEAPPPHEAENEPEQEPLHSGDQVMVEKTQEQDR